MRDIILRVEKAARAEMAKQDPAHDWPHIERVRNMALRIADAEGGNKPVIELAALVHDVGDRKAHGSEEEGHLLVCHLLSSCGVPDIYFNLVTDIARQVSFKGVNVPDTMTSLDGRIVQDADRLDAIGAIAIARTFTWGGAKGRKIHDPEEPFFLADNADEYYAHGGRTSINHFHEKLLHLQGRLHTETAKRIGVQRHEFMQLFLKQFDDEWHGRV